MRERESHKRRERARRRRPPPEKAGVRLCEAPHFNENRQRHIPALAAAAQTPALQQLLQPSPGPAAAPQPRSPAAPQPRSPAAPAAPRRVRTAPGGGPERGHKDPGRRLSADRCVLCLRWGRELRAGPAEGWGWRGASAGGSQRPLLPQPRGAEVARGVEGRAGAPLGPPPPPSPPFLERRCPAVASVYGRPRGCWHLPLLSGATGLETGSRARAPHPPRQAFRHAVSGDGEPGRRSWARCLSLSELAAERGPSLRLEGVAGPGLLLCVCFPVCPGGWCA